jgi:hypothetical protein
VILCILLCSYVLLIYLIHHLFWFFMYHLSDEDSWWKFCGLFEHLSCFLLNDRDVPTNASQTVHPAITLPAAGWRQRSNSLVTRNCVGTVLNKGTRCCWYGSKTGFAVNRDVSSFSERPLHLLSVSNIPGEGIHSIQTRRTVCLKLIKLLAKRCVW